MTTLMSNPFASHGGLLVPLDMFRVSHFAAVLGEALVAKARNIVDAKLVLTRHPTLQLVLGRITGTVVGDDLAGFWRDNADLALAASQIVPRQIFLYYCTPGPGSDRREGFLVAQRGQVLAADDASADSVPADAGADAWPVTKLCEQMGLTVDDLSRAFAGGPTVSTSLLEPRIDDQSAIATLAGQTGPAADGAQPDDAPPKPDPAMEDAKRRVAQRTAEEETTRMRAQQVASELPRFRDELGLLVAPQATLEEPEILTPFVVGSVDGDLPDGLPSALADDLQGQRLDIVVKVEFLSEVFLDNKPLSRQLFEEQAADGTLGNTPVKLLQVLAPRIGYGTLVGRNRSYVFVSRPPPLPLPRELVEALLKT